MTTENNLEVNMTAYFDNATARLNEQRLQLRTERAEFEIYKKGYIDALAHIIVVAKAGK